MRVAPVLAAVAVLASGCGGGAQDAAVDATATPTPTTAAFAEGVYRGELVTDSSTIKGQESGPEERSLVGYVLTCADAGCTTLHQRGDADPSSLRGQTYLFTRAGDTWTAKDVEVVPCEDGKGEIRQEVTWTWTRGEDGDLQGQVDQTVAGCGFDGVASLSAKAEAAPSGEVPYLPEAEATRLAAAVTTYDTALRGVYEGFDRCNRVIDEGTFQEAGTCLADTLDGWAAALQRLATDATALRPSAPSAPCAATLAKLAPPKALRDEVGKAARGYRAGQGGDADPAREAALEQSGTFHADVVAVASRCLSPGQPGLGKDGTLVLDEANTLTGTSG